MSLMKKYLFDEDESRTSSKTSSRFKNSRTTLAATSVSGSSATQKSQSQSLIKTPAAYELAQKSHSQSQIKTLFSSHGTGVGDSLPSFNSLTAGASSSTSISSTKSLEITTSSRGPSPVSTSARSQQYVFPAPEISEDKKLSLMQKYLLDDDENEPSLSLKTSTVTSPSSTGRRGKFQILIPTISIDDETMSTASSEASSLQNNFANVFTTNTFASTTTTSDFNTKNDEAKAEEGLLQKPDIDNAVKVIAKSEDDTLTSDDLSFEPNACNQNEKKENTSTVDLIFATADDNKIDEVVEVVTDVPLEDEEPSIVTQSAVSSKICDDTTDDVDATETSLTTSLDPLNNDFLTFR